jgi:nitroimidazol reductase NimA-like FMN-containing flavoprotein (pyridoxamine 5'-phosphate oxidase superfamily)
MTLSHRPVIRSLSANAMTALLVRNHVGRIAYSQNGRVDIEPIHYVYDAPWIFGRTRVGAKILAQDLNFWCAFETDDVQGLFDWESVVAKGPFSASNSPLVTWDYDRALAALRRFLPSVLGADDPAPQRDIVFAVHASEITGRCSVSNTRDPRLSLV